MSVVKYSKYRFDIIVKLGTKNLSQLGLGNPVRNHNFISFGALLLKYLFKNKLASYLKTNKIEKKNNFHILANAYCG